MKQRRRIYYSAAQTIVGETAPIWRDVSTDRSVSSTPFEKYGALSSRGPILPHAFPISSPHALHEGTMIARGLVATVAFMLCAATAHAEEAADHYFWRPAAEDGAARPWAVLLPGSGGMSILGDDEHYFRAATWLNERGVDALVVDYHSAARFITTAADGAPGDRMAAIVSDALSVERAVGRARRDCPAAVIAWSLGAEGAWALAQSGDSDFRGAVMFYPTVRRPQPYSNAMPVLVLQGTADNVTPEAELRSFLAARPAESATADVVTFSGASHGFDVPSLEPARTMRFPPLIGQRVTFGYNAEAAANANSGLESFLRRQGVVGGECAAE